MTPAQAIHYALELRDREAALREEARSLELLPAQRTPASRLFRRASRLRAMRLAVLSRCGLL